jgi:hypothetical protein
MGWADPNGWRGLRRVVREVGPTHVHAWGTAAAVAAAMTRAAAQQVVTVAEPIAAAPWAVLRAVDTGEWRGITVGGGTPGDTVWVAHSRAVARGLRARLAGEGKGERVHVVPAAVVRRAADLAGVREELELGDGDAPVLLLAGDAWGRARHDYGLWVTGILQTMFPGVRALVREDPRGRRDVGLERLLHNLSDGRIPVIAPAEFSWDQLLMLSDAVLVTADGPGAMGAARHAMAAGVPVVGTPVEDVLELVEDGRNGLVAAEAKPRAITARVEQVLNDAGLRARLTGQARVDVAARHSAEVVREAMGRVYEGAAAPA